MPIAFIVASAVALCFGRDKLDRKVDVYASGMGETNIMIMCLIFILAGAFAMIAKGSGAVDAAVAVRSGNILATAFHPELPPDMRIHRLFLEIAAAHGHRRRDPGTGWCLAGRKSVAT